MSEPLNPDPEIQGEIERTIAEMRRVEANYRAQIASLHAPRTCSLEDEIARGCVSAGLHREWEMVRRPYVERIQKLATSSRRNGITYLSPLTQELAGRIGQAVA